MTRRAPALGRNFHTSAGKPQLRISEARVFITLAVESGAVADMVAASLGHASFDTTQKHYAKVEAVDNARTDRVMELLDATSPAGATAAVSTLRAEDLINVLDAATLARLIKLAQAHKDRSGTVPKD